MEGLFSDENPVQIGLCKVGVKIHGFETTEIAGTTTEIRGKRRKYPEPFFDAFCTSFSAVTAGLLQSLMAQQVGLQPWLVLKHWLRGSTCAASLFAHSWQPKLSLTKKRRQWKPK